MKINHVGLIPDGNRRWAKRNGKDLHEAYALFFKKIIAMISCLRQCGVQIISIYIISAENLRRTRHDVLSVLFALESAIKGGILRFDSTVNFRFIGNANGLPINLSIEIDRINGIYLENYDAGNIGVNFLVGYSPFYEINEALKFNNELSMNNLLIPQPVDLIIRTGGWPVRISNFLPLQSSYAAIHVADSLFLDFNENDLADVVKQYRSVEMRYGK
jgi:undecaprenyl pyrophosphate synthase